MNLRKLLNELNGEYVLIFNEKLLDINSFNNNINNIVSFVVTGDVTKVKSEA